MRFEIGYFFSCDWVKPFGLNPISRKKFLIFTPHFALHGLASLQAPREPNSSVSPRENILQEALCVGQFDFMILICSKESSMDIFVSYENYVAIGNISLL